SIQKEIQVIGPPTMNVTQVAVGDPTLHITNTLVSSDVNKKVWRIVVVSPATTAIGKTQSTLTITTTHPQRPTILIPISVEIRGDLQVTPSGAVFGFVEKGETKNIALTIQSRTAAPFKLTGAFIEAEA